jgi:hypothetical protein
LPFGGFPSLVRPIGPVVPGIGGVGSVTRRTIPDARRRRGRVG